MDIADYAFKLKHKRNVEAEEYFRQAYELEIEIASSIKPAEGNEPSRSIFYLSAASLALNSKLYREAEKAACQGIIGYPSQYHLNELRDILEQANFERHLDTQGVNLLENQFQITFTGEEVGKGYIKSDELTSRLRILTDITTREVERKAKKAFRSQGRPAKVVDMYPTYYSVAMAGSYRVIMQIGNDNHSQSSLFNDDREVKRNIVDRIMNGIRLVNDNNLLELKKVYEGQENYYDFFVTSLKSFAPDGEKINMIGFTSINSEGKEERIKFTRTKKEIGLQGKVSEVKAVDILTKEGTPIVVEGILDFSKSRKNSHFFEIIQDSGKTYKFELKEGELASIVRDNYKFKVKVTGVRKTGVKEIFEFKDIEPTT